MTAAKKSAPTKSDANLLGIHYRAAAEAFGPPIKPIIDVHSHINGKVASRIYGEVAALFGIAHTFSMTPLEDVPIVRDVLGDRISFIAIPSFFSPDPLHEHREGLIPKIEAFYELGSRIVKFWAAPRAVDFGESAGDKSLLRLDSPHRREAMQRAYDLKMVFMTHVGDPNTWFKTKYSNASRYGTKQDQYTPLRRCLDDFPNPWIAAHMGGWPESLEFLNAMLESHENLYLDTSATKWMVRELSKHPRDEVASFLETWTGRILYGSDIVTMDQHINAESAGSEKSSQASSEDEAFDLYASRYWCYRTLFETSYTGGSPVADPDLAMVEPQKYSEHAAPELRGKYLPDAVLSAVYHDAATKLFSEWIPGFREPQ